MELEMAFEKMGFWSGLLVREDEYVDGETGKVLDFQWLSRG